MRNMSRCLSALMVLLVLIIPVVVVTETVKETGTQEMAGNIKSVFATSTHIPGSLKHENIRHNREGDYISREASGKEISQMEPNELVPDSLEHKEIKEIHKETPGKKSAALDPNTYLSGAEEHREKTSVPVSKFKGRGAKGEKEVELQLNEHVTDPTILEEVIRESPVGKEEQVFRHEEKSTVIEANIHISDSVKHREKDEVHVANLEVDEVKGKKTADSQTKTRILDFTKPEEVTHKSSIEKRNQVFEQEEKNNVLEQSVYLSDSTEHRVNDELPVRALTEHEVKGEKRAELQPNKHVTDPTMLEEVTHESPIEKKKKVVGQGRSTIWESSTHLSGATEHREKDEVKREKMAELETNKPLTDSTKPEDATHEPPTDKEKQVLREAEKSTEFNPNHMKPPSTSKPKSVNEDDESKHWAKERKRGPSPQPEAPGEPLADASTTAQSSATPLFFTDRRCNVQMFERQHFLRHPEGEQLKVRRPTPPPGSASSPRTPSPLPHGRPRERVHNRVWLKKLFTDKGHIFVAQDEYMLVIVNNVTDCSLLTFQEEINETFTELKFCSPSEKQFWHWVHPFEPGKEHTLHTLDAITGKLLFSDTATSLPVLPPPVRDVKVTGANGWLQLAFPQVREPRRSLVGYRVGYRRHDERKWRYVVSKAVQYSSERPFVRPRHPCRAFRADRTFCVLLTDHVRLAHALDARLYHLTVQTFRIVPEEEEEVISPETFRTSFNLTSCDWAVEGACPAIGVDEGLTTGAPPPASRRARAAPRQPPPLHATVPYPLKRKMSAAAAKGPSRPEQQMQERFKKYRREKNLWIHFLSLSLALALFGGPLLHMAAKWYGEKLARSFWSKMKNNVEKQEIEREVRRVRRRTLSAPGDACVHWAPASPAPPAPTLSCSCSG